MPLTAEQRSLRSRIAAYATNARHDGRAITAAARATYRDSFLTGHGCAVCPIVELPVDLSATERGRRADLLRRAHYGRLSLRSSRARTKAGPVIETPGPAMSTRQASNDEHPATR